MKELTVSKIWAIEILDSRANPTVMAYAQLSDGTVESAASPSGASTGVHEAHEKRDMDMARYNGKGVLKAVANINGEINSALSGLNALDQSFLDKTMTELDGTLNKSRLGANAILAVSLALSRAAARALSLPYYRYLGGSQSMRLPMPMMNILNGGAHSENNIDIQEFMVVPVGAPSFAEALRCGAEIYHSLKKILANERLSTGVGDEGGFAPDIATDEEAIEYLCEAIKNAGYGFSDVKIALDVAASAWKKEDTYVLPKRGLKYTQDELIAYWTHLCTNYPILSLEDALEEDDFDGWERLTSELGKKVMLVGDDLFVTNNARLSKGIEKGAANAILIKPNQIGTVTETMETVLTAKEHNYSFVISHRSGETSDTSIADIAVALNAPYIKTGAPARGERCAKYNRLLEIEASLKGYSRYGF